MENKLIRTGDTYKIDFEDFESKAKDQNTKLLILCSPHNPSGRVWTLEELLKIGRICIDNNVVIISDEIHFDLIMPGFRHTVFASISDEFADHSVICTAPSKTFNLAGLQTSNVIIKNKTLREAFLKEMLKEGGNPKCNILGIECRELARILKEDAHLFFDEGYIFGKAGEGFERWNLACPTKYVREGLERLKKALKNRAPFISKT